jgi:site-specific DNA recombinase
VRVAVYSRFSSDLQDARSIADQVALARDYALRQGWEVVSEFADPATSGASLRNRPGLAALLAAAKARNFDIVLTESTDRLSRDLEDMAGLHKRLAFWGVKIVTLADGEVGKLHVGLKGMMSSIFLDDLAQKTRRGQIGRVRAGRIPGGRSYGYDVVLTGEEDRGRRSINKAEAEIVRRIFREYISGLSPLAIATRLNREGVAAPRGGKWNASTINGSRKRANGILSNSLYVGTITYNRQKFVKDPATGRRQARPNAPSEWLVTEAPELRIVDPEIWEQVQARRKKLKNLPLPRRNRPRHLLSGLLACGACGASYIVVSHAWLGCSAVRNTGTCINRRQIQVAEIENRVLSALQRHLLAPEVIAAAIEAYRKERLRLSTERAQNRNSLERDLAEVGRKIAHLTKAIEDGGDLELLVPRLNELGSRRQELKSALSSAADRQIVAVRPHAADRYRQKVSEIHEALMKGDSASVEAISLIRDLVAKIVVHPAPDRTRLPLEIAGDLAVLMSESEHMPNGVPPAVVAGVGFEPTTFRL